MVMIAKVLAMISFVLLFNAGVSMMHYRRYAITNLMEDHDSAVKPPLDVKIETIIGTVLGLLASVLMFSSQLNNISMIHSYQNKTLD
mmetsp:Transcript_7726/g.10090  ORF Transcript_7726/g.10090 Transcript_7726/m.10090 type:complete len:87 (+) Transcript_7726:16-276(+)